MQFVIKQNPDKEFYDRITKRVKENDGYCPCMLFKDETTKCMCLDFREQNTPGYCHCERFYKEEVVRNE